VKYALLGYDTEGSLEALPPEDKRALHCARRTLHDDFQAEGTARVNVFAHYGFRPPRLTTTLRGAGDEVARTEGSSSEATEALRALYLLESDDPDAVLDLASQLPAVRMSGAIEVWPLSER
jgi:hypothetical protein